MYESYSYKQANLIHGILSSNMKNWNISYKEFISLEIKERTEIDSNSKNMFSVNVDEIIEKSKERYEYNSKCDEPLKYRQLLHFFSTLLNKEVFNISDILFKEMNFSGKGILTVITGIIIMGSTIATLSSYLLDLIML